MRAVGWYRLRGGQLFYGTLPPGSTPVDGPQQDVDPVDSGSEVGADVLVDEEPAETYEVLDTPTTSRHERDGDSRVVGHRGKRR